MTSALVLAGGLGTRLRSHLPDIPKVLAPIHNKPFLYYILDQLCTSGYTSINLLAGHIAPLIFDILAILLRV